MMQHFSLVYLHDGQNEAGYWCMAVALLPVGIPVFHERANMHYVMFCNVKIYMAVLCRNQRLFRHIFDHIAMLQASTKHIWALPLAEA